MASIDGSRSYHGASDETFDFICDPCKSDDIKKEGKHFCQECKEYLCDSCRDVHRRLKITKTHELISGSRLREIHTLQQSSSCNIYCSCNQEQQVEVYCEDHKDVLCNSCKKIKHWKCKCTSLSEKCNDYTRENLSVVEQKMTLLKNKIEQLRQGRTADLRNFENMTDAFRNEMKTFRKEIDALLEGLEENTLKDLEIFESEQKQCIEQHDSTLTTALQMLMKEYKLVEDAKSDGRKSTMFASDIKVTKCLHDYEPVLNDVEEKAKAPVVLFERNRKLVDLLEEIKSVGRLQKTNVSKVSYTINLLEKKLQFLEKVDVRLTDENDISSITGCAFMNGGQLLACDYKHNKIKLLDKLWKKKKI